MAERFAVYYAPPATSGLWERAALWLGRDAATGESFDGPVAGLDRDRLLNVTAAPSRYGFHATLRAPMTLGEGLGQADLAAAVADFAAAEAPVALGRLAVAEIEGFLALVPQAPPPALARLAQAVVEATEPLRAPLPDRERARRVAEGRLDRRQTELLERYGYPYVAEQFRFHMTLTGRLDAETRAEIAAAAQTWFGPVLAEPLALDRLSVFVEPEPGHSFRRGADFALLGPGP